MEISRSNSNSSPYSLFMFAIKSPMTRRKYQGRLCLFFNYIGIPQGTMEERCNLFVMEANNNLNWLFDNIVKFFQYQRERVEKKEIVGSTFYNYVKAIKLFSEMSDIHIQWKKITRGLPKGKKYAADRAPTIEEIRKIAEYPDRRIKPIVTLCVLQE